jgi:BASS family bile acid:Na+ symporter
MVILKSISSALARHTPLFVSLTAVFAFFVPQTFVWVRGSAQIAVLGAIMLAMGMTLSKADFKILAARPLDIALGALSQYTLMPLIAWALTVWLGLPREIGAGLVLVGCCPGGVSSNIMSFLCKGDVAFSVGMTTVTTLLSPVVTPLLMLWIAGAQVDVDAAGMIKSTVTVTVIPVTLGFLANSAFGDRPKFAEFKLLLPGIAVAALACIVGGVVSQAGSGIFRSGIAVAAAVFLHNALGYVLGYAAAAAAGFTESRRRTLSIEVGMQNAGLATVLAVRHLPAMPDAQLVAALSCIWHSVSGALLAGIFNRIDSLLARRDPYAAAAKILNRGGVAVIPTDTVYGLAARPDFPAAVERLYTIKGREEGKPIALLASDLGAVERFGGRLEGKARDLALKHWPGALTLVVGGEGFRVPAHEKTRRLIAECGGLLRVTSANISGRSPAADAQRAFAEVGLTTDFLIDDGVSPGGVPSTVVRVRQDGPLEVLRRGAVDIGDQDC